MYRFTCIPTRSRGTGTRALADARDQFLGDSVDGWWHLIQQTGGKLIKSARRERRELLCPAGLYVFPSCGGQHKLGFKVRVTKSLAVVYPSSMKNSVRLVTRPWPVNIIGFFSGKTQ